jgi:hypothetical protein
MSRHSIAPWLAVALAKAGCAKCNLQKSDKILTPWYAFLKGTVFIQTSGPFGDGAELLFEPGPRYRRAALLHLGNPSCSLSHN